MSLIVIQWAPAVKATTGFVPSIAGAMAAAFSAEALAVAAAQAASAVATTEAGISTAAAATATTEAGVATAAAATATTEAGVATAAATTATTEAGVATAAASTATTQAGVATAAASTATTQAGIATTAATTATAEAGIATTQAGIATAQATLAQAGALFGPAGPAGAPGGVDTPTAAVINEAQAALATKEDVPTIQTFSSSGSYGIPANAVRLRVHVQGAGGGGGGGASVAAGVACSGGAGGGGGAAFDAEYLASELTSPVTITVGTGGAGGVGAASGAGSGTAGSAGGNSSFGTYLTAGGGGGGGPGGNAVTSGGGGAGGLTQGGNGSTTGGNGGSGAASGGAAAIGTLAAVGGASGPGATGTAGGSVGGTSSGITGAASGSTGGGITTANTAYAGNTGGRALASPSAGGAAGAVTGGAGGTIATGAARWPGAGGGGGGASTTTAGGAGGAGQSYGGGGGGGGSARTGYAGGAGGAGGNGVVTVECWTATPTALSPVSTGSGVASPAQSNTSITAPNYGSAKFPDFNGQYGGQYGQIAQPTTNFGTLFGADGALFMELELPQERLLAPLQYLAFGSAMTGSAVIGLSFYGYSFPTTALQGTFAFYVGNSTGGSVSLASPQIPTSVQRVLVYVARVSNSMTLNVLDLDTFTLYTGTAVNVTSFTGISTFNGSTLMIGDCRTATAERTSWFNTQSAWPASIGRIGYSTASVTGTNFTDIAGGADPLTEFGASLKWYRALDGGASSLLRQSAATGDTTSAAVAYGRITRGGHLAQNCNVQLARVPDGLVFAALPGERFARVRMPFICRNIGANGDTLEMRIIDGTGVPILDWSPAAALVSGQTSGIAEVTAPISARWVKAEARLKSATTSTNMAPGHFGIGAGCGLIGQSQMANGMGRHGLGTTYDGQTAASLAWTITSNGVTGNVIWRLDQGRPVSDMLMSACQQAARVYPGAQGWIVDAVGGTGPLDLINNASTIRHWSQFANVVAYARDQLSCILFPWFTNLNSTATSGGATIAQQLDATLRGRGAYASDHYVFEPSILPNGGTVVVYPGSRHQVTGTFTADTAVATYGNSRDAMRAWVAAQGGNFLQGPEQIVTTVDNYHPADIASGDTRLGYSLGVGLGIGMRTYTLAEAYVDPTSFAFTSGARTAFTFQVITPGNAEICNFLGATYANGADKSVMGIQVSSDGGTTWTYLPASACQITGRFTVTATNPSGAWASGLQCQVMSGGPMAYGTTNADSTTAATSYGLGDNDARMLTGFGNPIKCCNTAYTVAG